MNQPNCIKKEDATAEPPGDSHYVYAAYLKPGYHQFIIYDPLIDKAFCQEMIVGLNCYQQIYPELPIASENLQKLIVLPPVFNKWIRDDIGREDKAYYIDTTPFYEKGKEPRDNF